MKLSRIFDISNSRVDDFGEEIPDPYAKVLRRWNLSSEQLSARKARRFAYVMAAATGTGAFLFISLVGINVIKYVSRCAAQESSFIISYCRLSDFLNAQPRSLLVAALMSSFFAVALSIVGRVRYRNRRNWFLEIMGLSRVQYERREASAQVVDHLSLSTLLNLNRAEAAEYHTITRAQASESFRNSQIAMFTGFSLIAVAILVAIAPTPVEAKVTIAAISAVGSAVSGYINRTFLNSHSLSVEQLNKEAYSRPRSRRTSSQVRVRTGRSTLGS